MSDGHGCDAGHACGHGGTPVGGDGAGYAVGADGKTPVSNIKRLEVNGAPVTDASHEYLVRKTDAPDQ